MVLIRVRTLPARLGILNGIRLLVLAILREEGEQLGSCNLECALDARRRRMCARWLLARLSVFPKAASTSEMVGLSPSASRLQSLEQVHFKF